GGDGADAGRVQGVRDDGGVGVVLDAGARSAAADRDGRGARVLGQGAAAAGGVRGQAGRGARGARRQARGGAQRAAGGAQVSLRVQAQRRVDVGADAGGPDGAGG